MLIERPNLPWILSFSLTDGLRTTPNSKITAAAPPYTQHHNLHFSSVTSPSPHRVVILWWSISTAFAAAFPRSESGCMEGKRDLYKATEWRQRGRLAACGQSCLTERSSTEVSKKHFMEGNAAFEIFICFSWSQQVPLKLQHVNALTGLALLLNLKDFKSQ